MRTFAERLKATREEQELSQVQLALRSGVSQSTIANIESGRNQGTKHILAIARALDVRPQWLEDETPPKRLFDSAGMNESEAERAAAELIARASSGTGKGSGAGREDEDTTPALKKLFAAYSQGGAAKQEAMLRLAELPEPEMATLLLVIQSIGSKYKK